LYHNYLGDPGHASLAAHGCSLRESPPGLLIPFYQERTQMTADTVQTGDQATLGSLLSPEIVWHQPGNNRFSGVHRGIPAVGGIAGGA
jgi:hypothetical protein